MGKDVIINKIDQNDDELVLSVEKGGTGGNNQTSAEQNLEFILSNKLNAPLGVAGLDNTGRVKKEQLPISVRNLGISIDGAKQVTAGSINNYSIVGYSSFMEYTLSVSSGTVTRNNEVITLTAPAVAQLLTLTINGKSFAIDVVPVTAHIDTPTITSPGNGAFNLGPDLVITASSFSITGASDTHEGTDWQIATDASFTNIVASVTNSTTDKLSWAVQGLQPATQYYIRTRYKGVNMGYSNWSATNTLTTRSSYVPTSEQAMFSASDKTANANFGYSCRIDGTGTRVIIGSWSATSSGFVYAGKAYIFIRSGTTWTQEAILTANDKAAYDHFGWSVDISNDGGRVVIGASDSSPSGLGSAGKAYIFIRSGTTWTQEAILTASDKAASDYFGYSSSINEDGTRVAIGAHQADPSGLSNAGKAYIFVRSGTTWAQEAILTASDKAATDLFGSSIDIDALANRVVIGTNAGYSGIYIFTRSGTTWAQEAKLTSTSGVFGRVSSISGDGSRVIVGDFTRTVSGIASAGQVYVFVRTGTTWTQETILTASDKASNDNFGWSLDINSDATAIVIGAYGASPSGINGAGKAYMFTRTGAIWTQSSILTASNMANSNYFGSSVGLSDDGTKVVIGSYGVDPGGVTNAGAAYIFS